MFSTMSRQWARNQNNEFTATRLVFTVWNAIDWKNELLPWAIRQHFLSTKISSPLVSLNVVLISNNSAALRKKKKKSPFSLARWITGRLFPCQGQCGFVSSRRGRFATAARLLPLVNASGESQNHNAGARGWMGRRWNHKAGKDDPQTPAGGRTGDSPGKRHSLSPQAVFCSSPSLSTHNPMNWTAATQQTHQGFRASGTQCQQLCEINLPDRAWSPSWAGTGRTAWAMLPVPDSADTRLCGLQSRRQREMLFPKIYRRLVSWFELTIRKQRVQGGKRCHRTVNCWENTKNWIILG